MGTRGPKPIPIEERFWPKVDKRGPDECWNWTAGRNGVGCGALRVSSPPPRRRVYAHRVSYEMANGPITDGLWVLHKCDNPRCVNPNHLFLGTVKDNSDDMVAKGRDKRAITVRRAKVAKVTEADVLEIRARAADGERYVAIARDYPIGAKNVATICRRQSWEHVP